MPFLYPVAVNCGDLTDPTNGAVNTSSGTTFNMNATYTCNTGYNLIGITPRTCQATNETWSGSEPTCESTFSQLYLIIAYTAALIVNSII